MRRFLIADDHEVIRRGLKQILLEEFPFGHFDEAGNTNDLIKKATDFSWDIIISDLAMPGGGGIVALQRIQKIKPEIPFLILSIYPEDQYALRVIREGASGYLNKDAAPDELVSAVHRILSGRRYITPGVSEQLTAQIQTNGDQKPHLQLSEREMDVFSMIIKGHPISEIAETLALGTSTVSTYRSRILTKMNMKNNAELIQYAITNNL